MRSLQNETSSRGIRAYLGSIAIGALLLPLCILGMALDVETASAATDVTWERFDVDLQVREDGSVHVTETQVIEFGGRTFSSGFAVIPMERIDAIENVELSEIRDGRAIPYDFVPWSRYSDDEETFSYLDSGDEFEIAWGFPLSIFESRTFVIEYDAIGAIRVYGDDQGQRWEQLWWTAISEDVTAVGDVLTSTVTIELPEAADASVSLVGEDGEDDPAEHTTDGRVWTWSERNLSEGDELIVRLEVPAQTEAAAPSWQAEDDERRLEQEKREDRRALYGVVFLGIGLALFVIAGAGLYGLWYMRGRDPHVGLAAEFLAEPPDDLPPGAAGALVDEVAHERDVVATIVDLGRRGVIKIDEERSDQPIPVRPSQDFKLTLLQAKPQVLPFEQTLLGTMFGVDMKEGATTNLSQVSRGFRQVSELIKDQMYGELVSRGYFTASPEETRDRWRSGSIAALAVLVFVTCVGGGILANVSPFVFFPLVVAALFAAALIFLSRTLPQKTAAGAEAAAHWNAFKRYLSDIDKYDRVNESKQIFDKYLPYAVAFGLEDSWVNRFAAAGAESPLWYGPVIFGDLGDGGAWTTRPRRRSGSLGGGTWMSPGSGGGGSSSDRGGGGFGGFGLPDLQDLSDRGGGSIQGASNSLFDMLSSAAEAFGDFSSSGGGGRRNWGGGGGGFRGGGSRGGSSGGGRRGFR